MKVLFVVNQLDELIPSMTTWMLISRAVRMGWSVSVAAVETLGADTHGHFTAKVRQLPGESDAFELRTALDSAKEAVNTLEYFDVVALRTNPGRDPDRAAVHQQALSLLSAAEDRGVRVVNSPKGLRRTLDKSYLMKIPENLRPATIITRSYEQALSFIEEAKFNAVLKPLVGSRGNDVFFVNRLEEPNLRQIFAVVARQGFVMIQSFVPEAVHGDTRIVVLDGRVLEVGGQVLAVRRAPGAGELRSNIHAGGKPVATTIAPSLRDAANEIAEILQADGISFAGLDFAGNLLLEANVFSTGGFFRRDTILRTGFRGRSAARFQPLELKLTEPQCCNDRLRTAPL